MSDNNPKDYYQSPGFGNLAKCPKCKEPMYSYRTISNRWIVTCTSFDCVEKPMSLSGNRDRKEVEQLWNEFAQTREKELICDKL